MVGLKTIFGTLLGFTIGFLILGFWKGEFNWSLWVSLSIGGIIGGTIIHFVFGSTKKLKNKNKHDIT